MATVGFAGPGEGVVRTLRRPSRIAIELPNGLYLRSGLLLLAPLHVFLILGAMPEQLAATPALLLASLATGSALIATAYALVSGLPHPDKIDQPAKPADDSDPIHRAAEVLELLARMNHDLRTPLNAVIGFSDLMHREMLGPLGNARYQEYARHIRDSGDILLRATEDALAMTALLAAPPRLPQHRIELSRVVQAMAAEVALEGVTVTLDEDEAGAATIVGDPETLMPAVRHVARAAAIHSDRSEPVHISVRHLGDRISVALNVGDDRMPAQITPIPATIQQPLGRETLPMCLARVLLGLQGMRLDHDAFAPTWCARIEMTVLPADQRIAA